MSYKIGNLLIYENSKVSFLYDFFGIINTEFTGSSSLALYIGLKTSNAERHIGVVLPCTIFTAFQIEKFIGNDIYDTV